MNLELIPELGLSVGLNIKQLGYFMNLAVLETWLLKGD